MEIAAALERGLVQPPVKVRQYQVSSQDSSAAYEKRIEDLEARIKKLETLLESGVQ